MFLTRFFVMREYADLWYISLTQEFFYFSFKLKMLFLIVKRVDECVVQSRDVAVFTLPEQLGNFISRFDCGN